ncbi:MAG: family 78 glycoside hydrolase catalytic domain [Bacteroidales bacterium]
MSNPRGFLQVIASILPVFLHLIAPILIISVFFMASCSSHADLRPVNLRTEYKNDPVIDTRHPRLSWELLSDVRGQVQTAWQVLVASSPDLLSDEKSDMWNSGKVYSNETNQIVYSGTPLSSRDICYWKIRSWDKDGEAGHWSKMATWEMGLLGSSDWQAEWIGNDLTGCGQGEIYHLPPAPFFRKEARIRPDVRKARLYVTALGIYEFEINGKRVGDDYFTPGWTDYDKRVYYQTYDVTGLVSQGTNAFGAILADGWYAGYLGYALLVGNPVVRGFYGDFPRLKARIEIEYRNGEKEVIVSDESWKTNHGPIIEADFLNGETYDANLEFDNWSQAGFDDASWEYATVYPATTDLVTECYPGNPVQVHSEIEPITVKPTDDGKYIFNMGQNFAGLVRLNNVKGNKGDTITLRFGEMLHTDGSLMTENLRMARATNTYIMKGNPSGETWSPRFTFQGFQYVEVSGFSSPPDLDAIFKDMLDSQKKDIAGKHLADLIRAHDNKLSTGFLGVRPLLPALSETGRSDLAYMLLLNEEYPGWLFEVVNGATTIWERWDSYIKEAGFKNASMNSFNHYAFGSVNEWMFANMAGIKPDLPGYRSFSIKPEIAEDGINFVKATYRSINEEIVSSWEKQSGQEVYFQIVVPVNTTARVVLPAKNPDALTDKGNPVTESDYLKIMGYEDGYVNLELGSGSYRFTVRN